MKYFLVIITGEFLGRPYSSLWTVGADNEDEAKKKFLPLSEGREIAGIKEIGDAPKLIDVH